MQLFSVNAAEHFSREYTQSPTSQQITVNDHFTRTSRPSHRSFNEGTADFADLRDCVLRESERYLFLSASNYRRFVDLLMTSSASWALVTAYYGCWYSAHALLGMFGCSILKNYVLDVDASRPGNQRLRYRRINGSPGTGTTRRGSHQQFWDLFYSAVSALRPIIPSHLVPAVSPVNGDPVWLIQKRNQFNYQAVSSIELTTQFENVFDPNQFENTLPGSLSTVYGILKMMLELTFGFAKQFQLSTDALAPLSASNGICDAVKEYITEVEINNLVDQIDVSIIS
ncbi:MAG: hypothetical protein HN368_12555 [Spirochaetales bacterium]|jgi:hypothetical protein|nr:hypothetical protein [Spirochaetales bacterium]